MHNDVATLQTYNGWSNRETWLVNLWLTNDEDSSTLLEDAARRKGGLYDQAEWLETVVRESYERQYQQGSLWADLMGTALNRVNWYELVEKY